MGPTTQHVFHVLPAEHPLVASLRNVNLQLPMRDFVAITEKLNMDKMLTFLRSREN